MRSENWFIPLEKKEVVKKTQKHIHRIIRGRRRKKHFRLFRHTHTVCNELLMKYSL